MDDILIAILIVQTVSVILFAVVVLWNITRLVRLMEKIKPIIEDLRARTADVLDRVQATAETYNSAGSNLVEASGNLKELSVFFKSAASEMTDVVKEAAARAAKQIDHADRICTDVLENGREAVDVISNTLIPPLVELSVVLRSMGVAFRYFLRSEKE